MNVTEEYYDHLERVLAAFPGREMICVKDAAAWLGIDPVKFYRMKGSPVKRVGGRYYVTTVSLARWMSA